MIIKKITVRDTRPPGGSLNFGTVAAGATTCQLVPTDAKVGTCTGGTCVCPVPGTTTDTATLTGTCAVGGDNACTKAGSDCTDDASVTCETCQISVDKTVAKDDNCDGSADGVFTDSVTQDITKCIVYKICVSNPGTMAVDNVMVTDSFPPGGTLNFGTVAAGATTCKLIPTDAKVGTCSGGACACPAGGTTQDTATVGSATCTLAQGTASTQTGAEFNGAASVTGDTSPIPI